MEWLVILALGGVVNLSKFHSRVGDQLLDSPHRRQAYATAFGMGALVHGGAMCLIYWVIR